MGWRLMGQERRDCRITRPAAAGSPHRFSLTARDSGALGMAWGKRSPKAPRGFSRSAKGRFTAREASAWNCMSLRQITTQHSAARSAWAAGDRIERDDAGLKNIERQKCRMQGMWWWWWWWCSALSPIDRPPWFESAKLKSMSWFSSPGGWGCAGRVQYAVCQAPQSSMHCANTHPMLQCRFQTVQCSTSSAAAAAAAESAQRRVTHLPRSSRRSTVSVL